MVILEIQSYPPNTAALGAGEQTSVMGVILHYQEEAYSGLENEQRSTEVQYGGGGLYQNKISHMFGSCCISGPDQA